MSVLSLWYNNSNDFCVCGAVGSRVHNVFPRVLRLEDMMVGVSKTDPNHISWASSQYSLSKIPLAVEFVEMQIHRRT